MKKSLLSVAIVLWLLLGLFYFLTSSCDCDKGKTPLTYKEKPIQQEVKQEHATSDIDAKTSTSKQMVKGPILFKSGNDQPILGDDWNNLKSKWSNLKKNEILKITGSYYGDETNNTSFKNLGLARADQTRIALGLDKNKVQLHANLLGEKADDDSLLECITVQTLIKSDQIDETIDNKTIIRFPYNSNNKLNSREVEAYLNKVAKRVIASGERIKLTGFTDDRGNESYNMTLGQKRADIIMNYLLQKGVSKSKIIATSQGENNPIATNQTADGRAENRRTELEIIK